MGFFDTLFKRQSKLNQVAALLFPLWEQNTPQYPSPSPSDLANEGYRRNELIYACVNRRAKAIAEAPLQIYDQSGETPQAVETHPLRTLLKRPNPRMGEKAFWRVTEMYLQIAGFACWEKERNNLGEVIRLWPMSPHWCAFRRGDRDPIASVEYKPYGITDLPPVPIQNVVLFQYYDPIAPLIRALSPSAVASRVSAVDNQVTDFLKLFFERGAVVNGLLKTEQSLNETETTRIRELWRKQHGGVSNWTDPAVMGSGVTYQQMQMDFRQMQFGDIDARDEARICQAFDVPPILVGAKVGLDRSTFSNYDEARKAFYEETIAPEWDFLESEVEQQLLTDFESLDDPTVTVFALDFDVSQVKALQEDRTAKWDRARGAFDSNLITRDEAREEMGLDPVDEEEQFAADVKPAPASPFVPTSGAPGATDTRAPDRATDELPKARSDNSEDADEDEDDTDATDAAREAERRKFKAYADKRIKENRADKVQAFKFKYLPRAEQVRVMAEALSWRGYP
jgi:HK97 family phage portal protein